MASDARRYLIQNVLGKGGFGIVYQAEMQGAGGFTRTVALKFLNPETAAIPGIAERLRDEARLLALLQHRAIVQVDGLVLLDGRWTVVMELLTGANLLEVRRAIGALPPGVALEVAQEVAGVLHAAWSEPQGPDQRPLEVLHRDIKPSNVQITRSGAVKVLDFGVARATFTAREALTRSMVFGSTGYMAPERLEGRDTPAGDVYALAVVLYELLSGQKLGPPCSRAPLQDALVAEALEPLDAVRTAPGLGDLLRAGLAFDPRQRPTAREFHRAARHLRATFPEPWLPDWAELALPVITDQQVRRGGPLTGQVLVESVDDGQEAREVTFPGLDLDGDIVTAGGTGAAPPATATVAHPSVLTLPDPPRPKAPPPAPVPIRPASGRRGLRLALASIGLVALGGLAWWLRPAPDLPEPVPPVVAPVLPEEPEAAPADPVPSRRSRERAPVVPSPALATPVASAEAVLGDVLPVERPPPPVEDAAPREPSSGTVRLEGDVPQVALVGAGGSYPPGPVPPGQYTLHATFPRSGESPVGSVVVEAGRSIVIRCSAGIEQCRVLPDG